MWLFRRRTETPAHAIRVLQATVSELREDLEALKAHHMRLRGRVYAIHGKLPAEGPEALQNALNPADPNLSKAQARALLMAQGRLKPTQN